MTRALALLALAIAGHACALQLVDVSAYAVFQHYRPWEWLLQSPPPAAWGLLVQTVVVAAVTWRSRASVTALLRAVPVRAWLALVILGGFSLAVPTESVSRYAGEVLLAGAVATIAALNIVLVALATPNAVLARLTAWADARVTLRPGDARLRRWDRHVPAALAVWIAVVSAVASAVVLERLPHIDDSISNLFQAKYFASGLLYLPAPPDAEAFRMDLTVVTDGRWFGYAFPGWPAVLALGVRAGAPWIVNPILGGAMMLLAHAWIRRRWDRGTANAVVLVLAASSWLIFTSAEMMAHPLTGALVLMALVSADRATDGAPRAIAWGAVTGLALGALLLTRTFDALLVGVAIGLLAAVTVVTGTAGVAAQVRRALPPLLLAAVIAGAIGALIFPYNQAVTGRATYPAHEAWADSRYGPGVDVLGFGPNVGIRRWPNLDPLPGHGPADVVLNANKNAFMVNADLFGWAAGSVLFIGFALGIGRWRRRDAPALLLPAIYLAGYSLFWFSGGPDLGARYWFPLIVPFALLTVRGLHMLVEGVAGSEDPALHATDPARQSTLTMRWGVWIGAATLSAAVVMLPWRAATKHYRYRGITGEVRALAGAHDFGRALVFVRAGARSDYQSAFVLNPPALDGAHAVYALDAGPASRAAIVARFGDRPVWVIGRTPPGPDGTQPFAVAAGPLAPGTVPGN